MSKCYGLWKRLEEWLPRKRLMQQIWRLINQGLGMVKMLTPERGNYMEWDLIQMHDHPWEIDFGYWLGPIYTAGIEGRAFIRLICQQAHNGCPFSCEFTGIRTSIIFLHSSRIFIAEHNFLLKKRKKRVWYPPSLVHPDHLWKLGCKCGSFINQHGYGITSINQNMELSYQKSYYVSIYFLKVQ